MATGRRLTRFVALFWERMDCSNVVMVFMCPNCSNLNEETHKYFE